MKGSDPPVSRTIAVATALLVTFFWSTSYILNQWAFAEGIRPLTLAGARYAVAAVALSLLVLRRRSEPQGAGPGWAVFALLGALGYGVAQGFQYMGQAYVTPTQTSLVLGMGNTLLVVLVGMLWLKEIPGRWQALGLLLALSGVLAYYYPWSLGTEHLIGIGWILLSGVGYALHLTATRRFLRNASADPLRLTLYPMGVGAVMLLGIGLAIEPLPTVTWRLGGLILWLGVVNGAVAFYLWTLSQRVLQAFESSMLNNSILLQVAALDVLFMDRSPTVRGTVALLVVAVGIFSVQAAARRQSSTKAQAT